MPRSAPNMPTATMWSMLAIAVVAPAARSSPPRPVLVGSRGGDLPLAIPFRLLAAAALRGRLLHSIASSAVYRLLTAVSVQPSHELRSIALHLQCHIVRLVDFQLILQRHHLHLHNQHNCQWLLYGLLLAPRSHAAASCAAPSSPSVLHRPQRCWMTSHRLVGESSRPIPRPVTFARPLPAA